MLAWRQLTDLPEAELARCDVAAVNLACAEGLPGAERLDVPACLHTLGKWTKRVHRETARYSSRFEVGGGAAEEGANCRNAPNKEPGSATRSVPEGGPPGHLLRRTSGTRSNPKRAAEIPSILGSPKAISSYRPGN